MSPVLDLCNHACLFCWRDIKYLDRELSGIIDEPNELIDASIEQHKKVLQGFKGSPKTNQKKFAEAMNPRHFAISLTGEPTFYPKLPELVAALNRRKLTSFIVSNGTNPSMLEKLADAEPTQMYVTLPAPDKKLYSAVCRPLIKNGWSNLLKSLSLLNSFDRSVIRLTLAKNLNLANPEGYAEIISMANPDFVECKAFMPLGYSRERLPFEAMPSHKQVKDFAIELNKSLDYYLLDEDPVSRVVLLSRHKKKKLIKVK
jgi:tRNA wybutosine-synthesizing protein 1